MTLEISLKQKALIQLARASGKVAQAALNNEAEKIALALQTETQYDHIETQLDILDSIAYRVHEKAIEIIKGLLARLENLDLTYQEVQGFPAERLREYQTNSKLIIRALEALERIRYHQPSVALDLFFRYSAHSDEKIAKQAMHGLALFAGFDLDIFYGDGKDWKGLGWGPQEKVLEKINSLTQVEKRTYLSGIVEACNRMLSPTIEGTTSTYKSVTLRSGAVPAIQGIQEIRQKTLVVLESLYELANTVQDKKTVIAAMLSATRTPHMGKYGGDVLEMIAEDTATVLRFMARIAANEDLQVTESIERDAFFFFRRNVGAQTRSLALDVKKILDNHAEYQVFKILIGFEGVFHEWREGGEEINYDNVREKREQGSKKLAESITNENYAIWKDRILRYAAIKSDDLATFPYFGRFLENLGSASPSLALRLVGEVSQELAGFTIPMLLGVWKTDKKDTANRIISKWVEDGNHLFVVARFFEFAQDLDENLFHKILTAAITMGDQNLLNQIIATVSAQFQEKSKHLIKEFFVPALNILTSLKSTNWIFVFWFRSNRGDILAALEPTEEQAVLHNLLWARSIDYHAEEILSKIAEKSPGLVVKFFCDRIAMEEEAGINNRYDAIPFDFHELSKPLSRAPELAVELVRGTYDGNYGMFIYRGARLLKNIFPDFPQSFARQLTSLVRTRIESNQLFVLAILRNYQGELFIHEICKELVKAIPDSGSLQTELRIILQTTGVVSGEYGFVGAYQRKIEEIKSWLDDPDKSVVRFAKRYVADLEKQILAEKQRADEGIALRKYQFGDEEVNGHE